MYFLLEWFDCVLNVHLKELSCLLVGETGSFGSGSEVADSF